MKKVILVLFIIFSVPLTFYLFQNDPQFPEPLPDSVRSTEPGDMETPMRRAYYTDLSRADVLEHYQNEMDGKFIPDYRLNYPPEEAQAIIRDQTKSTFLEEIVQPFRYSLFVNGFEPTLDKDALVVEGKSWNQKVTVRYVQSDKIIRTAVILSGLLATIAATVYLLQSLKNSFAKLDKLRKWMYQ